MVDEGSTAMATTVAAGPLCAIVVRSVRKTGYDGSSGHGVVGGGGVRWRW